VCPTYQLQSSKMSTSRSCSAQIVNGDAICLLPTGLKPSTTSYLRLSESPFGEEANLHTPSKGTGQQAVSAGIQPHVLLVLVYGGRYSDYFCLGVNERRALSS
jgi:hypothetical protein